MKTRLHDKKALWTAILITAAAVALYKIIPSLKTADSMLNEVLSQLLMLALAVAAALITKRLSLRKPSGKYFKAGMLASAYFLLMSAGKLVEWIIYMAAGVTDISVPAGDVALFVVWCLLIGISEELLFRGVLFEGILDYFGNDSLSDLRKAAILGGVLFGAAHLLNLTGGDDVLYGTSLAIVNMADGILYCAIYLYSGRNIWPVILMHALKDAINYLSGGLLCAATSASVEAAQTNVPLSTDLRVLMLAAFSLVVALYLLQCPKLSNKIELPEELAKFAGRPVRSAGKKKTGENAAEAAPVNEELKGSVELFQENQRAVMSAFMWDEPRMSFLCALAYSAKGQQADIARMKEAEKLLAHKTGIFSEFRNTEKLMLLVRMAQADDMEAYLDRVLAIFDQFIRKGLTADYYAVASMVLAQNNDPALSDEQAVEKTNAIFARMKENHKKLTSAQDICFAALLAVSGLEEGAVTEEMENCWEKLKEIKRFKDENGVQALTHLLALEPGSTQVKCDKVAAVFDALAEEKKRFGTGVELSILGGFAFCEEDSAELAREIAEADDLLAADDNLNLSLGYDNKQRLMYAAILVMQKYCAKNTEMEDIALSKVVSVIVLQSTIMSIAVLCGGLISISMRLR